MVPIDPMQNARKKHCEPDDETGVSLFGSLELHVPQPIRPQSFRMSQRFIVASARLGITQHFVGGSDLAVTILSGFLGVLRLVGMPAGARTVSTQQRHNALRQSARGSGAEEAPGSLSAN